MSEASPFDACESCDEIMAIVFDQVGIEGLRELVDQCIDKAGFCRQTLVEAAYRLETAGLVEPAELVAEAAERAPIAKHWKSRERYLAEIESNRQYSGGAERGRSCLDPFKFGL